MTIQTNDLRMARHLQPVVRGMRAPTFTLALLLACFAGPGCSQDTFTVADGGAGADGGGSAAGGSPGTGGNASGGATGGTGTGGANGDACAVGSVTLEVRSDTPEAYCTPPCDKPWVKIFDELGRPLVLEPSCVPDCSQCIQMECPLEVCEPREAFSGSLERNWDGTHYAKDICGAEQECQRALCTPAGEYRAEFCLERNLTPGSTCTPSGEMDCRSQTFSWPSTTPVQVTIPSPSESDGD